MLLGQRAESVVGKIERLELGELTDLLGQRAQSVVGKIELLELQRAGRFASGSALVGCWKDRAFGAWRADRSPRAACSSVVGKIERLKLGDRSPRAACSVGCGKDQRWRLESWPCSGSVLNLRSDKSNSAASPGLLDAAQGFFCRRVDGRRAVRPGEDSFKEPFAAYATQCSRYHRAAAVSIFKYSFFLGREAERSGTERPFRETPGTRSQPAG